MSRSRIRLLVQPRTVNDVQLRVSTPAGRPMTHLLRPSWLGQHIAKFVGLGHKVMRHINDPAQLGIWLALQHISFHKGRRYRSLRRYGNPYGVSQ